MKAIILAAGEGTRLRPLTLQRPKCLVEAAGKSLLDRQLEVLRAAGVDRQVIVGGYLAGSLEGRGSRLMINPDYDRTNMVHTLFCAEEEMEGEVLVTYGDIVYAPSILRKVLGSGADLAVAVDLEWEPYWRARNEDPLDDAESLRMDEGGRILEIGQQAAAVEEIQGQYMGLMKFSPQGLEVLKEVYYHARGEGRLGGRPTTNAYMTDLLQAAVDAGHRVQAVPVRGPWVEVDTVEDLNAEITLSRLEAIEKELQQQHTE